MPVSTDLPGRLDFVWYSGNAHTIALTFPSSLAGRTFEVHTVAGTVTVSVSGAVATFTVPALSPTVKQTQRQAWSFVETTTTPSTLIGGVIGWDAGFDDAGDQDAFDVTTTQAEAVTVSVSGAVALAAEAAARSTADSILAAAITAEATRAAEAEAGKQAAGTSVQYPEHLTTLGTTSILDDGLVIDVSSKWGITGGDVYYDESGATAGEEAILVVDPSNGAVSFLPLTDIAIDTPLTETTTGAQAKADAAEANAIAYGLARLALLTDGAPGTLDTFLEAYNQFLTDEAAVTALTAIVSGKIPLATVTVADDLIVASGNAAVTRVGVAASRIIGKKASGALGALTAAEIVAILSGSIAESDVANLVADLAAKASVTPWGIVRPNWMPQASTTALTNGFANTMWYFRLVEGGTISKVRIKIGTNSGQVCVSAHSNSGSGLSAVPGTRLATSGAVTPAGTGDQDISLGGSVTLAAGDWIGIGWDNTTATVFGFANAGTASGLVAGQIYSQTVFPAPTTPSSLATQNNRMFGFVGVP